MPFPLHKVGTGLLQLFRLQVLGANPPEFGHQVLPVTDVTEFYAASNKLQSTGLPTTGALTGAGLVENLALTGNIRLHYVSALLVVGAAAATNVTLSVRILDTAGTGGGDSKFFAAINAAAQAGCALIPPRPIVLPAGFTLRAIASGTAAGVDHSLFVIALIDNITPTA